MIPCFVGVACSPQNKHKCQVHAFKDAFAQHALTIATLIDAFWINKADSC